METITLNDLLGVKVKRIYSGSELMFIYELNKYAKEILNKEIDFSDIQLVRELWNSPYYEYVQNKGIELQNLHINSGTNLVEIDRLFFHDDLSGVVFESQDEEEWVYNYHADRNANLVLNKYNRSGGYVSLYAYMLINFYKMGERCPILHLKNTSPKQEELEYVDILILMSFGNCFLKDKVKITYSRDVVVQPEWEAYVIYQRQLGYMLEEKSPSEKYKYVIKNYSVGDVVLYYKTEKSIRSKTIRKLISCYPAVIRGITTTGIILEYYPDISTSLTHQRELEAAEAACNGEYRYSFEDYRRFSTCTITLDYYNLGIDLLFYLEDEFILEPQDGVDRCKQYLRDADGIEQVYMLGTLDTIYAVFEDRGIKYNKDKFKEKYFKKNKPIYDEILKRD